MGEEIHIYRRAMGGDQDRRLFFFQLDCMFLSGADLFPFSFDVHFCRDRYEHDLLLILPNGVKSCEDITIQIIVIEKPD